MKINEFILQNEELASRMQLYADQIHRLEKLIEVTDGNGSLTAPLKRQLENHKKHFNFLNDAYNQHEHDNRERYTEAFISEITEGITDIGITFNRLALIK